MEGLQFALSSNPSCSISTKWQDFLLSRTFQNGSFCSKLFEYNGLQWGRRLGALGNSTGLVNRDGGDAERNGK